MPPDEKQPMKQKLLDLNPDLLDELNAVSKHVGEPASVIARICLRAGLKQIKRENYELLKSGSQHREDIKSAYLSEQGAERELLERPDSKPPEKRREKGSRRAAE